MKLCFPQILYQLSAIETMFQNQKTHYIQYGTLHQEIFPSNNGFLFLPVWGSVILLLKSTIINNSFSSTSDILPPNERRNSISEERKHFL